MTGKFRVDNHLTLNLLDLPQEELLQFIIHNFEDGNLNQSYIALHVSFFLNLSNPEYIKSLRKSYLYADGMSVVLAAKFQNFERIGRSATTDLGPLLLAELSEISIAPIRIGIIGGDEVLINNTASYFTNKCGAHILFALNGYPDTWTTDQHSQITSEVDVVFIGMGVPSEQIFLEEIRDKLDSKIILTCGGLFGFLTGNENRAPKIMQNIGAEWFWRLLQSPRRLAGRYFVGFIKFIKFIYRIRMQ